MKKRYERGPAHKYSCPCGNQAHKWTNGGYVCLRCIRIENDKGYNREFCGVRPTHESQWAVSPV